MESTTPTPTTYLSRHEVLKRYSIGNTTLHRWRRDKGMNFPAPIEFTERCLRWKLSALEAWDESRVSVSNW